MEDVDGVNAGYARLLLDEYLDNPEAVQPEWRALFEAGDNAVVRELPGLARLLANAPRNGEAAAGNGHAPAPRRRPALAAPARPARSRRGPRRSRAARRGRGRDGAREGSSACTVISPRGSIRSEPSRSAIRRSTRSGWSRSSRRSCRRAIPASILRIHVDGDSLAGGAPAPQGDLLRPARVRDGAHRRPRAARLAAKGDRVLALPYPARARASNALLYARLCETEGMERYLRRSFLGQKQFSLEGLDVLIPMLDESIELAAASGAREVVIGMAHRGRLNVLAHTIGLPYEQILREFEGERTIEVVAADAEGGTGTSSTTSAPRVSAPPRRHDRRHARRESEPPRSGRSRGRGDDPRRPDRPPLEGRSARSEGRDADPPPRRCGVRGAGDRRRDFNLYALEGYSTGGTLHIITNNQVGFTTDPAQGRSTRHSWDLAKGYDSPIIHVNADDPGSCDLGDPARARLPRAVRPRRRRSISSGIGGSVTTSRTSRRTRSRSWPARSTITRPSASSTERSSSSAG